MKLTVNTHVVSQLLLKIEEKMVAEELTSFTLPDVELDGTAPSLRTLIARVLKKDSGLQEIMGDDDKAVLTCSVQNGSEKLLYDLVFSYMSPNGVNSMIDDLIATGFNPATKAAQFTGTISAASIAELETKWSQAIIALNAQTVDEVVTMFRRHIELDTVLQASDDVLQPLLDEAWTIARLDYHMWNDIDMGDEGYTLHYVQHDTGASLTITKVEEILDGRATNGEEVRSLMAANT